MRDRDLIGLLLIGVVVIFNACYNLYLDLGTSTKPTTVNIADLAKRVPANRNLIVVGGRVATEETVTQYVIRYEKEIPGSDFYFVPVYDPAGQSGAPLPTLLLWISGAKMNSINRGNPIQGNSIRGIRTTQLPMNREARALLEKAYGGTALKKMIVLDFEKQVKGPWRSLILLAVGCVLSGSMVALWLHLRKQRRIDGPI